MGEKPENRNSDGRIEKGGRMKTEKDKEGEGRKKTIPGLFARKILRKTDDASGGKREFVMRRDETAFTQRQRQKKNERRAEENEEKRNGEKYREEKTRENERPMDETNEEENEEKKDERGSRKSDEAARQGVLRPGRPGERESAVCRDSSKQTPKLLGEETRETRVWLETMRRFCFGRK